MKYPAITLKLCDYAQLTLNKSGDLSMTYKPLQNLIKNTTLGSFTSKNLNFDRYTNQDMLIVDEFDGSTNIIINDDTNSPKLINSGFSVLENNTFLIPEHYTQTVTNIYDDKILDSETQLLKLYNSIPKIKFDGLGKGGFKCGSYVFYFRLSDSVGNMSNVIQHSSIVQVFIGELGSYTVRMGLEEEVSDKSVMFTLSELDSGFDYVRVFYEKTSSGQSQASTTSFYMVDLNFPIINGKCILKLTGEELVLGISLSDLKNEYADIQSCKTQTILDNTLFLANTSAYTHDYLELQRLAWCIYPEVVSGHDIDLPDPTASGTSKGYYDPKNVYEKIGYWPDEYYRFGIVFIYNNNQLSPVFNISGYDALKISSGNNIQEVLFKNADSIVLPDYEPTNYIFKTEYLHNSKGVFKTPIHQNISDTLSIKFNYDAVELYIQHSPNISDEEKVQYRKGNSGYDLKKFLNDKHGIKGFFFVRLKRIPTTLAQGIVIGLTGKDYGCIPILKDGNVWKTKSFLSKHRLLLPEGSTISTWNTYDEGKVTTERVVHQALLIPDAELQEATFNLLFTSQEYSLYKNGDCSFDVENNETWWKYKNYQPSDNTHSELVKLTAVPKDTKVKTNGIDFFSTVAGNEFESYKTENILQSWNKTVPQELTKSTSLIRGRWGYFVGMSKNKFNFGDVVSIKKSEFIKNADEQNLLEFLERFKDYSFYSPISTRYSCAALDNQSAFIEYGGDCFLSMFTHRMMSNFIDPELATNRKIVDPTCWCKNYAVRCTAEILSDSHSNLVGDSAGFYIPAPTDKKSAVISLVFGILTGNFKEIIESIDNLSNPKLKDLTKYANEVANAFEIYTGNPSASSENYTIDDEDWIKNGGYDLKSDISAIEEAAKTGKIKKVTPAELELDLSGFNLKALFKCESKWELHGVALINRGDVNAVSFGLWITFPVRSSLNLALRDIDFSQATEEASLGRKRSFYPLEKMDISNAVPESNVINSAIKKSIHKCNFPAYKTVPFIKLEYFNRIYWSKPNISDTFLNSYRMIYSDQYKEYNKEFGSITKILPINNKLFVCFDHGMGILPVDRSPKTDKELSIYLASRNVLPNLIITLSGDLGSMWKNSIIQTPTNVIYGVDTIAKKIWRTQGTQIELISDHYVSKFLNDFIDLSEFDYKSYLGHIDVKTHYNNFKRDVIFTLIKDIPTYIIPKLSEDNDSSKKLKEYIMNVFGVQDSKTIQISDPITNEITGNAEFNITYQNGTIKKKGEIQNGKIYINDIFTGVLCDIESWKQGAVWSMCYNENLNKWTTFYDWYPIESCNVNNIFFSFDQEQLDSTYDNNDSDLISHVEFDENFLSLNKYFIDQTFSDVCKIYDFKSPNVRELAWKSGYQFASYYVQKGTYNSDNNSELLSIDCRPDEWEFKVFKLPVNTDPKLYLSGLITQVKFFNLPDIYKLENGQYDWKNYAFEQTTTQLKLLQFYDIRDYNPNRMFLWKHGQAGLYDNQGKIKPTHWYGKQHEFNFEFVVNENPIKQKIFNNLKLLSNKTAPTKFEYEIVGEGYEWFEYKSIVEWINKKAAESGTLDQWYLQVLGRDSKKISDEYPDFPSLFDETRIIQKLPYLKMKHTDKKGTPERPHYKWDNGTDYWGGKPYDRANQEYTYNCSEPCLVEGDQLNEVRLRTESLGNDIKKYGRIRGNMQYLEDLWNIEIRPVQIVWCYLDNEQKLQTKKVTETKHRDKYIKVKIRYSGEDLALIQQIYTIFEESYA